MDRRQFLRHSGAISGSIALGQLAALTARGAAPTDYKALVCVFLYGGNDSNNTIVPVTTAAYQNYAALRGPLALGDPAGGTPYAGVDANGNSTALLPLVDGGGQANFGVHNALSGVRDLWNSGELAVVANVGTLTAPLTKAAYTSGKPRPENLFSHIDQQHQWQTAASSGAAISSGLGITGWGGRLMDRLASLNAGSSVPAMISTAGNNLLITAPAARSLVVPATGTFGVQGFSSSSADVARRTALTQLLGIDNQYDLVHAAEGIMSSAMTSSALVNPLLTSTTTTSATYFSGLTSGFAKQLLAIAKLIEGRSALGAQRQLFLVNLGSFDTHTNQIATQQKLYADLGAGLKAFHSAMTAIGAASNVTSFTLSDFSRTLKPNTGGGSDHGWGSHHFVAGGAVKGKAIYGTMPTLQLGGTDDEGSEGRWIPTTSVDQYAATLATWFGATPADITAALPNFSAFPGGVLHFL
jgi:uncharacterized protein (DUF1501 family)